MGDKGEKTNEIMKMEQKINKDVFKQTVKLYHYTKFENAIKILESKSLLFSELKRMNDINESLRPIMYFADLDASRDNVQEIVKKLHDELYKYRQLSFTKDDEKDEKAGYSISAMWGHYAEKGYGVCLVFDKQKLISELPDNCFHNAIKYDSDYCGELKFYESDIGRYFNANMGNVFFTKTDDWKYEQEYRIISKTSPKISIENSLMAIIMYMADDLKEKRNMFKTLNVNIIHKIAPQIPILDFCFSQECKTILRHSSGEFWNKEFDYDKINIDIDNQ